MTPEGRVKEHLKRKMEKAFGSNAYRFMPVQNGMGAPSVDFLYCICGKFVAIETKSPGKHPTDRQYATLHQIARAGGTVYVVHNDDEIDVLIANVLLNATFSDTPHGSIDYVQIPKPTEATNDGKH